MKKSLSITFLCSLLLLTGSCRHEAYTLQSVVPERIEVTRALDANPVAEAVEFLKPYLAGVDSLRSPYVGQSELFMTGGRPESLLSNWVADALVATGKRMGYAPDLGICNMGGLRAAMPQGTVRRGDILAISPFENFFTILTLKGSDLLDLMENIAEVHGEGVSSSVRLVITRGGQLKSAKVNGENIDPGRLYTIATLDYLADGNDKLHAFKRSVDRTDTDQTVNEALMEHLRLLDAKGQKATAAIEGRIVEVNEGEAPLKVRHAEVGDDPAPIEIRTPGGTDTKELLVVHTNDTHSCIEPLSPLLADTAQADKGGYLRRAALLRDLRKKNPGLLLFDCGDFSQGSAYYSLYHGNVEVGLMNFIGYDAATIGNHEFDYGVENMARIFRLAKFPIVCCNYDFTGTAAEGLVKPYVILKRSGLRIGVLGVSPELEGLVAANTCKGVTYTDPIEAAQPVADYLKNEEKCDLVICLSHLGWQVATVSDEDLIPATRNIDIVLGGHSHTYFRSPQVLQNADGIPVPDNQMGKNGRYVGTLRLTLTRP